MGKSRPLLILISANHIREFGISQSLWHSRTINQDINFYLISFSILITCLLFTCVSLLGVIMNGLILLSIDQKKMFTASEQSWAQLALDGHYNNYRLKRWSVITWVGHIFFLQSLHRALLGYCVWRGSHCSLWNVKKKNHFNKLL